MDVTIFPRKLSGSVQAIASKSQAHRLLICAAFADQPTVLSCPDTNRDIEATAACLNALGAQVIRTETGYQVFPVKMPPQAAHLPCGESGSTLRFLLPVAGALGVDAVFHMEGRLSQRPLSPLWEEMERMGCVLSHPTANTLRCQGKLHGGSFSVSGGVSSQFITGLLFACALLEENSVLHISGKIESLPYLVMTCKAMEAFHIAITRDGDFHIPGGRHFCSPGNLSVEGDWSNVAFFLAANTLGSRICVTGLNSDSPQGDREILELLPRLEHFCTISAADIPDLVPILAVTAASKQGAVFTDIRRLRLKESDRVASVNAMLQALGVRAEATENTMTVWPGAFLGGTVDSQNDHRIAMAAAIAATAASGPVTILDAQCVQKSYPKFWDVYKKLGGSYEQHIR